MAWIRDKIIEIQVRILVFQHCCCFGTSLLLTSEKKFITAFLKIILGDYIADLIKIAPSVSQMANI